jgi:hypothetical protein
MRHGWTLVIAGCAAPEQAIEPAADPPPSAYVFEESALPEPTATLAEVESALQEGLDRTMSVSAAPVQAAYEAAMAGSTAACPYVYATPDGTYWYDSCMADDGSEFDGYVFAYGIDGLWDPNYEMVIDYWYAFGGATVTDAGGRVFELAGTALAYHGSGDGLEFHYSEVGGTFEWDGPEADGTWLRDELDPDLITSAQSLTDVPGSYVLLYGGFGGFAGGWAVAYDENLSFSESLGGRCDAELSGTVGVRAPDGSWYDVQFQGWDGVDPLYDGAGCDGCGEAYYQGEALGSVCVDLSTLQAMGVDPW